MNHIDLFSGISGFAIAAKEVWQDEYRNIAFCDNNAFAQAVLRRHFPEAAIYGDIRELTRDKLIVDTDRRRHVHRQPQEQPTEADEQAQREPVASIEQPSIHIDLLTGGFPCQPFSQAGKRKGVADNRYLWPEMLRVIQDLKPTWVIAENVRGLLTMQQGMVFENICLDLEKSGYEVQPFIIPACAVNAPHRRDRVWIVANSINNRQGREITGSDATQDTIQTEHRTEYDTTRQSIRTDCDRMYDKYASDTGCELWKQRQQTESKWSYNQSGRQSWDESWLEAATRLCLVDDGIPRGLVRLPDGTTISRSKWRQEALKAAGNAIVPQVAIEIMKAIKETEQPPQAAEKGQ